MVALAVVAETQGLANAAVADPVSAVVPPTQTANVPVMVGSGFTVITADKDGADAPPQAALVTCALKYVVAVKLVYVYVVNPLVAGMVVYVPATPVGDCSHPLIVPL